MSSISEQNILGDPALASVSRPGLADLVATYSFSNQNYEMLTYEAMSNARGGNWARPTFYAPDPAVAEAEKGAPTQQAGAAGEPTTPRPMPTQYGGPGNAPLTENLSQKTKIEQVAEVVADKKPASSNPMPDPMASSTRSAKITQESAQGPVASGGQFNGHEQVNQYWMNYATEEITAPAPIENTGADRFAKFSQHPLNSGEGASLGSDNPQANRGSSRPMPGAPGGPPPKQETTGQSAVKQTERPSMGGPSGDPMPGRPVPRVHKPSMGGPGGSFRPGMGVPGSLDQSMRNS